MKKIEDLTFADGFMFQEIMKNPKICKSVIELLLHMKVGRIEYPELEKSLQPFYIQKGVRFDVYTEDNSRCFDVEIQNYNETEIGKRCRYYQSMLDSDQLSKGMKYSDLKENYIIFLCSQDPFGLNLPCYTFENICRENTKAEFNDKSLKVIYNFGSFTDSKDPEIQAFLEYLKNQKAGSRITMEIEENVERTKTRLSFINAYMAYALHDNDVKTQAEKEATAKAKLEAAVIAVQKYNQNAENVASDFNVPLADLQAACGIISITS